MVTIIIAVKNWNDFLKESLGACLRLAHRDFEVIVLPDEAFPCELPQVRIIPTGPCLPAEKRDAGARHAKGDLLAFLDDDAYPSEMWLTRALEIFKDPDVAAVGGPGVTPPDEELLRRASGCVYESFAASGNFRYRYVKDKRRWVDDFPSCNLLIRKDVFDRVGGFKTNFWPGEDTVLCLEVTKRLNKKIVYDPEVLVYHHRRSLFGSHLRQVANYAEHRGYFVKRFPETSLRWQYFVPSIFLLFFVAGGAASFLDPVYSVYLAVIFTYGIFIFVNALQTRSLKMILLVFSGIFLTHLCYGLYFIRGLCLSRLKEETKA